MASSTLLCDPLFALVLPDTANIHRCTRERVRAEPGAAASSPFRADQTEAQQRRKRLHSILEQQRKLGHFEASRECSALLADLERPAKHAKTHQKDSHGTCGWPRWRESGAHDNQLDELHARAVTGAAGAPARLPVAKNTEEDRQRRERERQAAMVCPVIRALSLHSMTHTARTRVLGTHATRRSRKRGSGTVMHGARVAWARCTVVLFLACVLLSRTQLRAGCWTAKHRPSAGVCIRSVKSA